MSLISLNCRGLGNPDAVASLELLIRFHKPHVLFLMEMKLSGNGWEKLKFDLGFENGVGVAAAGRSGGLCLFWNRDLEVVVKSKSQNHIDAEIREEGSRRWWPFSGVYGWPTQENHYRTWELLNNLYNNNDTAWLCVGDFNQICSGAENAGGRLKSERQMLNFNNALEDCGLRDLGFIGYPFTWDNGCDPPDLIEERLDRAVANKNWMDLHPKALVFHLEEVDSDHLPILIDPLGDKSDDIKWGKCFRFESFWAKEEECSEVITKAWEEASLDNLKQTLKHCEMKLSNWSSVKFGEIPRRITQLRRSLRDTKLQFKDNNWRSRKRKMELELKDLLYKNEQRWKQRARMDWLKDGDKNTKVFHAKATKRRKKNTIKRLRDDQGRLFVGQSEVTECLLTFFSDLYKSNAAEADWRLVDVVEKKVTDDMNRSLLRPFTGEEIKCALFQMGATKAP
ncbi:LINE-1 retrotransposable element ORF2 protein [Linum grandiflorum]